MAFTQGLTGRCRRHSWQGGTVQNKGCGREKDDVVALANAHEVALREDHKGYFDKIIAEPERLTPTRSKG